MSPCYFINLHKKEFHTKIVTIFKFLLFLEKFQNKFLFSIILIAFFIFTPDNINVLHIFKKKIIFYKIITFLIFICINNLE